MARGAPIVPVTFRPSDRHAPLPARPIHAHPDRHGGVRQLLSRGGQGRVLHDGGQQCGHFAAVLPAWRAPVHRRHRGGCEGCAPARADPCVHLHPVSGVGLGAAGAVPRFADAVAVAVQAEGIELQRVAGVGLDVEADTAAFKVRLAPALHRVGHVQVRMRGLEGDGIRALAGARGCIGIGRFGEQHQAAVVTQRPAGARTEVARGTVALRILRIASGDLGAGAILENDVDDAGDGIGAIHRRGTVLQHFDALVAPGGLDAVGRAGAGHAQAVVQVKDVGKAARRQRGGRRRRAAARHAGRAAQRFAQRAGAALTHRFLRAEFP
ncbi:hypothetical protein G6F46_013257 [Rhizopus delemar]|nr:hypothetical protein G6F46_013257 [Rhizopus delemar]